MNDDELRAALSRRVSRSLSTDQRNDIIRSARLAAGEPAAAPLLPRLGGLVVGMTALLVLAVVVAPILLAPPSQVAQSPSGAIGQRTSAPASEAATTEQPSPIATTGRLPIYSPQQLSDLIGDTRWVGETVLADLPAAAIQHDPCASPIATPLNA